jgi:spermidine synthase
VKPTVVLAQTLLPDRTKLVLRRHDGQYHIHVGDELLMSTTATASEAQMAELAHAAVGSRPSPKVLIGGFGLGFTLRRVLQSFGSQVQVEVAEFLPQILAWNREYLWEVNGSLLDDPRVQVVLDDVVELLRRAPAAAYDAVLLDIDNGPQALVDEGNDRLYTDAGLDLLARTLRPGGRAVFWSGTRNFPFLRRLRRAGFRADAVLARAYPQAKVATHTLFVADWNG